MGTGTHKMHASPSSTSLGNIPGKLLCYTLGGNREKGKANKGLGRMEVINLGCHQVLPLMHLHPTSVVVPGGTSKMPPLVRDRLSLTREGELPVESLLHPHLEQGRTLPVEKSHCCGCRFFLSYRWEPAVPEPLL